MDFGSGSAEGRGKSWDEEDDHPLPQSVSRHTLKKEAPSGKDKSGTAWATEVDDAWDACILTLDGGGVRAYSSLLILQALMHKICVWEERLEESHASSGRYGSVSSRAAEPRESLQLKQTMSQGSGRRVFVESDLLPCHYFDFMYGTSTGGLIATLLGRLRMTVTESLDAFRTISNDVFGREHSTFSWSANYHHGPLERAIQDVVGARCHDHESCSGTEDLYPFEDKEDSLEGFRPFDIKQPRICQCCCLTASRSRDKVFGTHLFRTYNHCHSESTPKWISRYNEGADTLTIWQVIRDTCAIFPRFDPLEVEVDGQTTWLEDGGRFGNNPSGVAINEFHSMYQGTENPSVLLSIGTGLLNRGQNKYFIWHEENPYRYVKGEEQHMKLLQHAHGEQTWYKRLNVSSGLEKVAFDDWGLGDWHGKKYTPGGKTLTKIEEATQAYLSRDDRQDSYATPRQMLSQLAEKLVRQRRAREELGGVRWETFVGDRLSKKRQTSNQPKPVSKEEILKQRLRRANISRDGDTVPTGWSQPNVSVPDTTPESDVSRPADEVLGPNTEPKPISGGQHSHDRGHNDKDLAGSTDFPIKPAGVNEPEIVDLTKQGPTLTDSANAQDVLFKSILYPVDMAQQAENLQHDALTPLLHHLRCSSSVDRIPHACQLDRVHATENWGSIRAMLQGILCTLTALSTEGSLDISDESITLFVEDEHRDNVLFAVSVAFKDVFTLYRSLRFEDLAYVDKNILFKLYLNKILQPLHILRSMNVFDRLTTLCLVLSISIISYTGSHCWDLDERLVPPGVDQINIGEAKVLNGNQLTFRRRSLGCLDGFLGAKLWALGGHAIAEDEVKCKVSLTLPQFADLWGPVWAVPAPGNPKQLLAVHTEGGMLYRYFTQPSHGKHTSADVQCHWEKTLFTRRRPSNGQECGGSGFALLETDFLGEMVPFDETAQLVIGTSRSMSNAGSQELEYRDLELRYQTQNHRLEHQQISESTIQRSQLLENLSCCMKFADFRRDNCYQIRMAGTAAAIYLPESYQASFTAGKYIGVGAAKTFKRRPASTMKQRIVEYCSKPVASLHQILELQIGLEVSACSGNAQRISLWQALMMAYGTKTPLSTTCAHVANSASCARECWGLELPVESSVSSPRTDPPGTRSVNRWTPKSGEFIAGLIGELSLTGLLDNGEFQCLVSPCHVFSSSPIPEWSGLLKDTEISACFAKLTTRCLTYDGRDLSDDSRKVRKCCTKKRPPTVGPVLCTSMLLKSNAQHPETWFQSSSRARDALLTLGQKFSTIGGHLVVKNPGRPLQLLSYHRRFIPWTLGEYECREFFEEDANPEDLVRVCIM